MTGYAPPASVWLEEAHGEPEASQDSLRLRDVRVSPELVLGPALLEAVRLVVRSELQGRTTKEGTGPRSPWMSPPAAARATGVPVKTIRTWATAGRIAKRLKNLSATPKLQKYLVSVDDVVKLSESQEPTSRAGGDGAAERARALALKILADREAKGR